MKKIYAFAIVLLFTNSTFGQNKINIAFGEHIDLGNFNKNITYTIAHKKEQFVVTDNEINNFVFKKPGIYKVSALITDQVAADHDHEQAAKPDDFEVFVSDSKIIFDPKSIQFSKPIQKNINCSQTLLSIDVLVFNYNNTKVKMSQSLVQTSGIGTNIQARLLKKHQQLLAGKHTIQYLLTGVVTENSYLMFDFINPNGTIQSIALPQAIAN